jgi:hypothetical protein
MVKRSEERHEDDRTSSLYNDAKQRHCFIFYFDFICGFSLFSNEKEMERNS